MTPFKNRWAKYQEYRNRFSDLNRQKEDLDFLFCEYFSDLRAEFGPGERAGTAFIWWCTTHLSLTSRECDDVLDMLEARKEIRFRTAKELAKLGGASQVKDVLKHPKPLRSKIVSHARAEGSTLKHAAAKLAPKPEKPTPVNTLDYKRNCSILIQYLQGMKLKHPQHIQSIIDELG